jgi:hypothetical protein
MTTHFTKFRQKNSAHKPFNILFKNKFRLAY